MNNCIYYKEEAPYFPPTVSKGIEIEMISICTRPSIETLGVPSEITPCGGNPENCPFNIQEKGFFQY